VFNCSLQENSLTNQAKITAKKLLLANTVSHKMQNYIPKNEKNQEKMTKFNQNYLS